MPKKKSTASAKLSGPTIACQHGPWEDRCGICDPTLGVTLGSQGPAALASRRALLELAAEIQDLVVTGRATIARASHAGGQSRHAAARSALFDSKVDAVGARIRALSEKLHLLGDMSHEAQIAQARADAFREAARLTDRSSDMIRKTRGGVARACSELDMATRDLNERANQILAAQDGPLNERERERRRDAMRKVFELFEREACAPSGHGTATLFDLFPEFHEALTGRKP